ncbi:MAG: hypothetical protein MMC33_005833 [Icmadophila ericetorum]|nr:hypothetical protein [Icmadophila ericetorum]
MVELLIQRGARINIADKTCRSALSWAALNRRTAIVEWLLSQGLITNINSFDNQHSTPLHLAFERHHYDIVDLLMRRGASLNIVDQWQRTAAQLAFSGPLPVDLEDYVKDKSIGKLIAPGGQARVSVFRIRSEKATIQDPYPFLFRKAFDVTGDEGEETLRLLVQERQYLRNLHHSNIVKFIAYEESNDHCKAYLYTEYCNGSDLTKFVRKDPGNGKVIEPYRGLSKLEIWNIFADLAAAVSYLHWNVIKEENRFSLKMD